MTNLAANLTGANHLVRRDAPSGRGQPPRPDPHVADTRTRGDGQLGQAVTDITAALATGKTVGEGQTGRRGRPSV